MNTNNPAKDERRWEGMGEGTPGEHVIIASVLESLAEEYFPEFHPEFPQNGMVPDTDTHKETPVQRDMTEGDYIRAIQDAIGPYEEPVCPDQRAPAAFLPTDPSGDKESCLSPWPLSGPDVPAIGPPAASFDIRAVRKDFPILSETIRARDLIWFDNAATTQKPKCVIERLGYFYEHENSNVHRAAHTLAARTTDAYEEARSKIASFIHAAGPGEIIFVRGATEGINLVAHSYGLKHLSVGDEVVITLLEHHANIVPWQMVCRQTGARLKVVPVDETGQIILSEYERYIGPRTRIVAFTHVSNALGTITPASEMVHIAHRYGAKVLIDGAQAVAHIPVDVQELDCDFYVFSGHKVFGPMGVGVLYGKADVLGAMGPYQGGGSMIEDVTMERTLYKRPPHRFEAGTASIADAIALGAAADYVSRLGLPAITAYEDGLCKYGVDALSRIPGLTLVGTAAPKTGILSFVLENIPADAVGKALDEEGIAVRAGHHCAQPVLRQYGYENTVRASLALYNTREEIDVLTKALWRTVSGY